MRTYIVALLALSLVSVSPASADPSDAPDRGGHDHAHGRRHDYSRFSDGPRRVPTPRGASLARAQRLGLGTREAASTLLHRPLPDAWREAADWRDREVDRLLWPVDDGNWVRGYGYVRVTRPELIHNGVDISAPVGTFIRAAADGIVAYSDNGIRGFGNCVIIAHPNGWVTVYAHTSRTTVQAGWRVRRGERIALVGSTGISRGPHLHFELRERGRAKDPVALFDGGPAYVRRAVARAVRADRVAPPQPLSAYDRHAPPPLAPWAGDEAAPAAVVESGEGTGDDDETVVATLGGLRMGSARLYRRLTRFRPTDAMKDIAGGRLFSNVLWPMRGGRIAEAEPRTLHIESDEPRAVRAAADGLVVYVGRVRHHGQTILMLHRSGWVTLYAGLEEVHVEVGQRLQRGEWIAETDALEFEVRVDGRRADPMSLLVQVPEP